MSTNGKRRQNKNQKRKAPPQKVRRENPLQLEIRMLRVKSFPGEQTYTCWSPGPTQLLSTTLTSFSNVYAIGNASTQIGNFTDFSNQWDQYVILQSRIEVRCITPPTPGTAIWFFDGSANAAVPVAADEYRNGVLVTSHSMNTNKVWKLYFKVVDNQLLAFRNTTVDYVVGYFKSYTDLARFGTSAINTLMYNFRVFYLVLYKGRKV